MGPLNRFFSLICLSIVTCAVVYPQTATTCAVSAVPPVVRSEGLTERMGDIVLQCSGSPGAAVSANLNVYLPVPITNRVNSNFFATDATLTIDSGSGPVAAGVAGLVTNQTISFSNLQYFPGYREGDHQAHQFARECGRAGSGPAAAHSGVAEQFTVAG